MKKLHMFICTIQEHKVQIQVWSKESTGVVQLLWYHLEHALQWYMSSSPAIQTVNVLDLPPNYSLLLDLQLFRCVKGNQPLSVLLVGTKVFNLAKWN